MNLSKKSFNPNNLFNTTRKTLAKLIAFCFTCLVFFAFNPDHTFFNHGYAQPIGKTRPFTVVILPDTQGYLNRKRPELKRVFLSQIQWVQDHALDKNILMVIHLGDIVMSNDLREWENAKEIFENLDNWIPYVFAVGNHDASLNSSCRGTELFNHFFPVRHFLDQKYLGGVFEAEKTDNAFYFFKVGSVDYMVITLEFAPRDEALDWANKVIAAHLDHKVFVITHAYLGADNERLSAGKMSGNLRYLEKIAARPSCTLNDGEEIWQKLGRLHKNIQFIFSGHALAPGASRIVSVGDNGNPVFQIMSNYQFLEKGGNGYMRIMEFNPNTQKIKVITYSPYLGDYKLDNKNNFVINLNKGVYEIFNKIISQNQNN